MSEEVKKTIQEAREFYQKVKESSEKYQQSIPDKHLTEKIKKLGEGAGEVVKHITERTDH